MFIEEFHGNGGIQRAGIILFWGGNTVTRSHSTKCNTNSKVRALS